MIEAGISTQVIDSEGNVYNSLRELGKLLHISRGILSNTLKKTGEYCKNGITYKVKNSSEESNNTEQIERDPEYINFKKIKSLPFEKYEFKSKKRTSGSRYAVALFSDAHIEETVSLSSVLGKNEYNIDIAKQRIEKYFVNLASCLNIDHVEQLIFASLGDTISGYIHDELSQTNGLSPLEATLLAQNLIYSGLSFLCENTKLKHIQFIGIVGNHSRTTKKIQHSNGYKLSYEWLMYKNIEQQCKTAKLPITFNIPDSELAIVDTDDNRRFIFCHGYQVKSGGNGTVCGIYPALNRLSLKWSNIFNQTRIFLGHFHSCTSITNAVVNGSIIGYNTFAMSNGFMYEEPCQYYVVYDSEIGELLERKIYCNN
jgi:hypothetical protein